MDSLNLLSKWMLRRLSTLLRNEKQRENTLKLQALSSLERALYVDANSGHSTWTFKSVSGCFPSRWTETALPSGCSKWTLRIS